MSTCHGFLIHSSVDGHLGCICVLAVVNRTAMDMCALSHFRRVRLFVTLWTVALQASLSIEFSRQEYWNGLPSPLPGDLPNPGIELTSLTSPLLAGGCFPTSAIWEAHYEHRAACIFVFFFFFLR